MTRSSPNRTFEDPVKSLRQHLVILKGCFFVVEKRVMFDVKHCEFFARIADSGQECLSGFFVINLEMWYNLVGRKE
jgi:hypothetical protein